VSNLVNAYLRPFLTRTEQQRNLVAVLSTPPYSDASVPEDSLRIALANLSRKKLRNCASFREESIIITYSCTVIIHSRHGRQTDNIHT